MRTALLASLLLLLLASCRKEEPTYGTVRYQVQCGQCTVQWSHLSGSVTRNVSGGIDAEGSVERGGIAYLDVWSVGPSNATVSCEGEERHGSGTDYVVTLGVPD